MSHSCNSAEGCERKTTEELLSSISRGSATEVRSMLWLCDRLPMMSDLKSDQRRALSDAPQNSDIKSQGCLTENARRAFRDKRDREAFLEGLRRVQEENIRRTQNRSAAEDESGRLNDE